MKYKLSDVLAARTNGKRLKDCSEGLRELFKECPNEFTKVHCYGGFWDSPAVGDLEIATYRISYNWPPSEQIEDDTIKAPEGYRIVSTADRERCKYPRDCEVKWLSSSGEWFLSSIDLGWKENHMINFAVPTDYEFKEDRKKERWFFHPADKKIITVIDEEEVEAYQEAGQGFIEITAEQKAYLETKPEQEEGFDWVLKVPEGKELVKNPYSGTTYYNMEILTHEGDIMGGIRWVRVPVAKPAHNFTRTETWYLNGEPFYAQVCRDAIEHNKRIIAKNKKELEEKEAILAAFEKAKGERK